MLTVIGKLKPLQYLLRLVIVCAQTKLSPIIDQIFACDRGASL